MLPEPTWCCRQGGGHPGNGITTARRRLSKESLFPESFIDPGGNMKLAPFFASVLCALSSTEALAWPGGVPLLVVEVEGTVGVNYFTTGVLGSAVSGDPVKLFCEVSLPGQPVGGSLVHHDIDLLYSSLEIAGARVHFAPGALLSISNDAGSPAEDGLAVSLMPFDVEGLYLLLDLRRATADLWNTADLSQLLGSYTLGDFQVATFDVLAGHGALSVAFDRLVIHEPVVGTTFCGGDGSANNCPCGNLAAPGAGCVNSTGGGAVLTAIGSNKVIFGDLGFQATGLPLGVPVVLFAGEQSLASGQGVTFGDGLRCAGVGVRRLGTASSDALGRASWGPINAVQGAWLAGDERTFQLWYVDQPSGPCGAGFNTSNGVHIEFRP